MDEERLVNQDWKNKSIQIICWLEFQISAKVSNNV